MIFNKVETSIRNILRGVFLLLNHDPGELRVRLLVQKGMRFFFPLNK